MTKGAEAVLADALRLDLDARAQVAAELLASLDGPADPKLRLRGLLRLNGALPRLRLEPSSWSLGRT